MGKVNGVEVIRQADTMRARARALRRAGRRLVLVPTMGSLHRGHLALVSAASSLGDHVTVSIFVNPTQFAASEDLVHYPRDLARDCALLERHTQVDTVFAPPVEELYPGGKEAQQVWVKSTRLAKHLCGPHRPGHFTGVLTVVTKLFNCCLPHAAVFGLKDAQQLFVVRRLVQDLAMDIDVVGHETVREADGLALSSRNAYLTPSQRSASTVLSKSVFAARAAIVAGERSAHAVQALMTSIILQVPDIRLQYAEVVRTCDLQPVQELRPNEEVLAAVAAYAGQARLIDNVIVRIPWP